MTEYMLSVYMGDGPALTEEEMAQTFKDVDVFNEELKATGAWVFAGGLHPADTATVISVKDGDVLTTDGPYAETKEQLGGFWIIRADDLDAALDLARRGAVACRGAVEVRPFQDVPS